MNGQPGLQASLAQARQLIGQRRFEDARRINDALLAQAPTHPGVLVQASRLAASDGRYRRARDLALKAFAHRHEAAVDWPTLMSRLQMFHLRDPYLAVVDELMAGGNADLRTLDQAAAGLGQLDLPAKALEVIERALAKAPGHPELLLTRAQTLVFLAEFDRAGADLAEVLRLRPGEGYAWWLRARLPDKCGTQDVAAMEAVLAKAASGRPNNEVFLCYALHNALDGLREYERAAAYLDRANRLRRAELAFTSEEDSAIFSAIRAQSLAPSPGAAESDRVPIFIIGLHRSGTTLLEQLISSHPQVRGLGEIFDFPEALHYAADHLPEGGIDLELVRRLPGIDHRAVGRRYLESLATRLGPERFFTDKLPGNYYHVGALAQALPQARILLLVRDPMEVCFSNLREFFSLRTNRHSYDQEEMGRHHLEFSHLMAHWRRLLPGRILDVSYSRLVEDTETVMREVCGFCGLDFDPAVLSTSGNGRAVTTASAVQVRSGVVRRDQPKWLPYADYLAPLARVLGRD